MNGKQIRQSASEVNYPLLADNRRFLAQTRANASAQKRRQYIRRV
jgi:hypothetical protein